MTNISASSKTLSIILPVFQEAIHIESTVNTIRDAVKDTGMTIEFVLIDDGSTDESWAAIKNMSDKYPDVRSIGFTRNFGKEYAIYAGLEHASGDVAVVMDSDLQHPPAVIPDMLSLWREEGIDVVHGIKAENATAGILQRTTAKLFHAVYHSLIGIDLTGASDFKLLDRKVINAYINLRERNLFFRGIIPWLGFKSKNLPFTVQERVAGKTKWTEFGRFILGMSAITSFSYLPLQFVTFVGCIFTVLSGILGLQTLWKWASGEAVEGFATIILLLLITGSVLMISLGIIGQYLAKMYREIKRRPNYVLQDKSGFSDSQTK